MSSSEPLSLVSSEDPRPGVTALYRRRFGQADLDFKSEVWGILCQDFFSRFIPKDSTVLDLGAGSCEFINAVDPRRRIAVDLNPDTGATAAPGVEVHITPSDELSAIAADSVDIVFSSNFFEHLPGPDALLATLAACRRVLVPGGMLIVLMPNIRYTKGRFWDYFDHQLPLTHLGLVEALELASFEPETVVPRFLPYTVRGRYGAVSPHALRIYLRLKPLWRIFGAQMFVTAHLRT